MAIMRKFNHIFGNVFYSRVFRHLSTVILPLNTISIKSAITFLGFGIEERERTKDKKKNIESMYIRLFEIGKLKIHKFHLVQSTAAYQSDS